MLEIVAGRSVAEESADALVVGTSAGRSHDPGGTWVAGELGEWLDGFFDDADFTGKAGQIVTVPGGVSVR